MRYDVQTSNGVSVWDRFSVRDTNLRYYVATLLTESEARIIAFALNAVAQGYMLGASPGQDQPFDFDIYNGPTEGVAS